MSGARERMAKEMMQRGSGESHQRQRRNQKDSNDIFALTNTDELQLTGFDCSDYNIGRNQFPDEDEEQQQQEQEPDFADSNEDLLDHGGEDSNDLGVFDLATLCLVDVDAEDGPDLHLCKDISKAKGQIIPYEYRVYLSKTIDDDGNKEQGSSPVAVASKAGPSAGSSNAETSRIDIVRDVERRMMAHVASKMGLADCDSSTSTPAPANRALRRRSLDNSGVKFIDSAGLRQLVEDSQSPLIGISSDPVDGISDCPENSPNLPFHCMYVKGHLAAYFDATTDDAVMSNYANVIANQISVGMDTDIFVDERTKLFMYIPPDPSSAPAIPSREEDLKKEVTSEDQNISNPFDNKTKPQGSSSNTTYIGIGVGCVVASVVLLSLFVFIRRRRVQKFVERSTDTANDTNRRHDQGLLGSVSDTQRATQGDDSYCIEVEVSDTETVAMSVNKDGFVGKVREKADSQGTAATEDDCETIATQESGVTLYLERVGSDVSALTWYGPTQTSNRQSSGSLGRGLEAIAGMGAIKEDEEEEEEDDLELEMSSEESTEAMNGVREGQKNQSKPTTGSDSLCYSSTASSSRGRLV